MNILKTIKMYTLNGGVGGGDSKTNLSIKLE